MREVAVRARGTLVGSAGLMVALAIIIGIPTATPGGAIAQEDPVERRPLLVILIDFEEDLSPQQSVEEIWDWLYGAGEGEEYVPNLQDFMRENSYGQFEFADVGYMAWVPAWDDPNTTGQDESTRAYWESRHDWGAGDLRLHALKSLDAFDETFRFDAFDTNGNGVVSIPGEVGLLVIHESEDVCFGGSDRWLGSERQLFGDDFRLDGVKFDGYGTHIWAANHNQFGVAAHELSHHFFSLADLYGDALAHPVNRFSLMGFGRDIGADHLSPFEKQMIGWLEPFPVWKDGWYTLRKSELYPDVLKIVNPRRQEEYLLVENRHPADTYDAVGLDSGPCGGPWPLPDEGIVVWHVDEEAPWHTDGLPQRMRYLPSGGVTTDYERVAYTAEDGYIGLYRDSSPQALLWNDGTPTDVAIWCFPEAGETAEIYIDLPEAPVGFLATPRTLEGELAPGCPLELEFTLLNTGEAPDDYIVSVGSSDIRLSFPSLTPLLEINAVPVSRLTRMEDIVRVRFSVEIADPSSFPPEEEMYFGLLVQSVTDPSIEQVLSGKVTTPRFAIPGLLALTDDSSVKPGETVEYTITAENLGPNSDKFTYRLVPEDFGNEFKAFPTSIPQSWLSAQSLMGDGYSPAKILRGTLSGETGFDDYFTHFRISVPSSWAGWENTTYRFAFQMSPATICGPTVTVEKSIKVQATYQSQMRYIVAAQLNDLLGRMKEAEHRSLEAKVQVAIQKAERAANMLALEKPKLAYNMIGAAQQQMEAYILELDAVAGTQVPLKLAEFYKGSAGGIVGRMDAVRSNLALEGDIIEDPGPHVDDGKGGPP